MPDDLPEPTPGKVRCLGGCEKKFMSEDKCRRRICDTCTKKLDKERGYRIYAARIDPSEIPTD